MQEVIFKELGRMDYKSAWDYQEVLLQENVKVKSLKKNVELAESLPTTRIGKEAGGNNLLKETQAGIAGDQAAMELSTRNYLLFVEHPPVYTLGKSGHIENLLIGDEEMQQLGISFFKTNRGGDITFHGPGQIVGYPILDLENFYTDIGKYLRNLEEVIILTMAEYGLKGERSAGETGVWLDPEVPGKERKICAMGVRCSRWITMHGFAFNVNTNLDYFNKIIPCGIENKQVTSLQKELNTSLNIEDAKEKLKRNFEKVFGIKFRLEI
jgi:lipoyl(octanoyl) transferase